MIEGVRILSFTHYLQGPSAVQNLADLGADVIKIEPPKGAYERHWSGCNTYVNGISVFYMLAGRNQRAVALDLKSEDGVRVIYELVKKYDVVVENFKVGVMDRLGLGYEKLKEVNPRVIYCSCSGYGASGPKSKQPGQDLLAQGMGGLAELTGPGDRPPSAVGTPVVDQHAAVLAALGILAAIYNRDRTGDGCKVDNCLLNAAIDLQQEPICYFMNGGKLTERPSTGLSSRMHQSPYGIYKTKDSSITLSLTSYSTLKEIFSPGSLDSFKPEDQMENRIEFDRVVATEMLKRTTAEWTEIFERHSIWYAPVNFYPELVKDPQVIHNEIILELDTPEAGPIKVLNHPVRYNGKAPELRRNPPKLGEHTVEVLREIGYADEAIKSLLASGIAKGL
ncbi:MAG: CoA transferase [Planctomycetota bacterium]|nr:CoA transferase [Planctomycetota bacterium]